MALTEGNRPDSAVRDDPSANDAQSGQMGGAPAIPDEAVAAMLGYVSDRASVQGGKVIDIAEVFIQAMVGEDTVVGEAEFEKASGRTVDSLVETVRAAAIQEGVSEEDVARRVHVRLVDEIEQQRGARGWSSGNMAWVDDTAAGGEVAATRTTLHEAAHAVTGEYGHGPLWRRVYGRSVEMTLPPDEVAKELERVAAMYDDSDFGFG